MGAVASRNAASVMLNFNSYIGPVSMHGWRGRLKSLQLQHGPYQRIGGTGSVTQVTLNRAPMSAIATWTLFTSQAFAQQFAAACEAMQAFTYQVQDDYSRTFQRVRVHAVTVGEVQAGAGEQIAGGAAVCLVRCNWTLEVLP